VTYKEAVEYILQIPKFATKNDLKHTRYFLQLLGAPQENKKIIHVAGTNGKGSVCMYLQEMLRIHGKKVGMFSSPHLVKINERMKVDACPICDEEFLEAFEDVLQVVRNMQKEGIAHPTFFEFLFGMGMLVFDKKKVEYIILETGMGGRLDATNAIEKPILSVITSIGMDHVEILGETIEEIAREKAGILKQEVPAVFLVPNKRAEKVIEEEIKKKGMLFEKVELKLQREWEMKEEELTFFWKSKHYEIEEWSLKGHALYQIENVILALTAFAYIIERNFISEILLRQVLMQAKLSGRMEKVKERVFIDGAHNEPGIAAFVESVEWLEAEKKVILFAAVKEKQCEKMIQRLCAVKSIDVFVVTQMNTIRSESAENLARLFRKYTDKKVIVQSDLKKGFMQVDSDKEDGVAYCVGSLYMIGEIKAFLEEN